MPEIAYTSEEEWRKLRAGCLGSTEAPALFDASPYLTRFALWHAKKAGIEVTTGDPQAMEAGNRLEPAIAEWAADIKGWSIRRVAGYIKHPTVRDMGCSLDYYIDDPERGPGILEIKNRSLQAFMSAWSGGPPPDVRIQVQHQFACTGFAWGAIACLAAGNDLHIYPTFADTAMMLTIEDAVTEFWRTIDSDEEPEPFGHKSEEVAIRRRYPDVRPDSILAIPEDDDLAETARLLAWAQEQGRHMEKVKEQTRALIMARMKDAERMILPGVTAYQKITKNGQRRISVKETGDRPRVEPMPWSFE